MITKVEVSKKKRRRGQTHMCPTTLLLNENFLTSYVVSYDHLHLLSSGLCNNNYNN